MAERSRRPRVPPLPAPMTAAEAHAAAAAEGLCQLPAEKDAGLQGRDPADSAASRSGEALSTAGAATTWATRRRRRRRSPRAPSGDESGAAALAAEPAPMTAAEAHAAAAAEGLTLLRAENATGFKAFAARTTAASHSTRTLTRRARPLPRHVRDGGGGGARLPRRWRQAVAARCSDDDEARDALGRACARSGAGDRARWRARVPSRGCCVLDARARPQLLGDRREPAVAGGAIAPRSRELGLARQRAGRARARRSTPPYAPARPIDGAVGRRATAAPSTAAATSASSPRPRGRYRCRARGADAGQANTPAAPLAARRRRAVT